VPAWPVRKANDQRADDLDDPLAAPTPSGTPRYRPASTPVCRRPGWAGHSVHVLLRVYAKCILGQQDAARQRIAVALEGSEEG